MPDGGQDQRQLDLPRRPGQLVMPSIVGGLDQLVGDRQQRGIDQHHRDADELPDRDQRDGEECRRFLAQPGREQEAQPEELQEHLGDAPERRQDQLPDEADDHDGQHRRHEDQRAVDGAQLAAAAG